MPDIISKGYSIASQVYGGLTSIDNFIGQYGPKQEIGKRKSIDGFVSNQLQKDLARKAHFRVRLHPPKALLEKVGWGPHDVNDKISMMAQGSIFPDIATQGIEAKIGTDNEYSIVNSLNYATFDIIFICDVEMTQRKFFQDWIDFAYNKGSGFNNVGGSPEYYKTYIGRSDIYQLKHNFLDDAGVDEGNDWEYMNRFHEVYPMMVQLTDSNWGSSNEVQLASVRFHYKSFEVINPPNK